MIHKNVFSFCFPIILFLVFVSENIIAQSNAHQDHITDQKIVKNSSNPVLVQIPGGYRVEVENNPLINKNQTALEVIRAMPGVIIKESGIEIMGKADLLLQVNGLDKRMDPIQLADYLSSISGENIKQVEIIRNPSSLYTSSVGSVINIITKNTRYLETSGNVRVSLGNLNKFGLGLDLSLNKPKFDFSLSVAESYNKTYTKSEYKINTYGGFSGPGGSFFETFDKPDNVLNVPSVNAQFRYKVNGNNIIGVSIDLLGNALKTIQTNTSDYLVGYSPYDRGMLSLYHKPSHYSSGELDLIQNIKKRHGISSIDLFSISKFKNKSQLELNLNVSLNNKNDRYLSTKSQSKRDTEDKYSVLEQAYTLKAIYKFNLSKAILLETGAEYIYSELEDKINSSWVQMTEMSNPSIINTFKNNNYITSAHINFNLLRKKWNYSFGLRAEYMSYNWYTHDSTLVYSFDKQLIATSHWSNHYSDIERRLYPSVSVNYKMNEKQLFSLVVKQNITLPDYKYFQPYNYHVPTFIIVDDNFEEAYKTTIADLTYILQPSSYVMYMLNGGIRYSEKISYPVISVYSAGSIGGYTVSQRNKSDMKKLYLSFSSQNVLNKKVTLGMSVEISELDYLKYSNYFYGKIDQSAEKKFHPNIALSLKGNISFPNKINFNFIYQYNSSNLTPQGKIYSSHYLNLLFVRAFMKDRMQGFLAITNPFIPTNNTEEYALQDMGIQYKSVTEAPIVRIGASYKFGKTKRATIQKQNAIRNTRM